MKKILCIITLSLLLISCGCSKGGGGTVNPPDPPNPPTETREPVIINSKDWPRYFTTKEGNIWVPIATNYLPSGNLIEIENYFKNFSENGGNAMRIWISTAFLEIEDSREGTYSSEKFNRIDYIIQLAKKYNVKIKFTLQHIRTISPTSTPDNDWSNSKSLATKFTDINHYVNTTAGRASFLNRVRALANRYKNESQIYGWELWNEMDAAVNENSWYNYTEPMIDSVKKIMIHQNVTQTLGSMHSAYAEGAYAKLAGMTTNDFLSIHRYLDEGTAWDQYAVTKGPMDILAADAVKKGLDLTKNAVKPVVMNEIGAVQPNHAGPSALYERDNEGTLLHDMIFAPFFSGAAGTGSPWHWDSYIYKKNLWYHFKRFANAIKDIDPIIEKFVPVAFETNDVRCYALKGSTKTIIWCRDAAVNWKTELEGGIAAIEKTGLIIDQTTQLGKQYTNARFYNPWADSWINNQSVSNNVNVPLFKRSIVIVLQ